MVATLTDEDIWRLNRGGHDPLKVYAAYAMANEHRGNRRLCWQNRQGLWHGHGRRRSEYHHSQKKMGEAALRAFRDRFNIPIPDDRISEAPFFKPPADSPELT